MSILEFREAKREKRKLTMVTCYDYWSAKLLNESGIEMLLVGDSAAMVMHGFDDTIPATVDLLIPHVSAVRRGAPKKFIIADLPFLAYRGSLAESVESVRRLMQAGAHAVKLEGYDGNAELVRHLTNSGVPVMGHVGLTPQFVNAFGGFRVQGRSEDQRRKVITDAKGLEAAGCFSVVLECIPGDLAGEITDQLQIPTIGIGAGATCDGQVLVLQDLLGLNVGFKPKFVRPYLNGAEQIKAALENFREDVVAGRFPSNQETYE
jgi:3-methyl-2-oxobutanoate hydroxymethyltransferase